MKEDDAKQTAEDQGYIIETQQVSRCDLFTKKYQNIEDALNT